MPDKRGQGGLLWWIPALIIMSGVFGLIVWLGVSMYSVHSDFYDVQKEMIYERSVQNLETLNPLTGTYTLPQLYTSASIASSIQSPQELSMLIHWKGQNYFYNQTGYELMRERVPIVYELRNARKQVAHDVLNVTVIQRREQ